MSVMTEIILVRHGETSKNVAGKIHSIVDDEQLNKNGIRQIEKASEALKDFPPDIIFHSNELRAQQSAEIIANSFDIEPRSIKGLQERNWGIYSGKPWAEVQQVLEGMSLEERYLYIPSKGESWKEVERRLIRAIEKILKTYVNKRIVVVSHGGSIRVLMPYFFDVSKEESFKYDPPNASISIFRYESGKFDVVQVCNTNHL